MGESCSSCFLARWSALAWRRSERSVCQLLKLERAGKGRGRRTELRWCCMAHVICMALRVRFFAVFLSLSRRVTLKTNGSLSLMAAKRLDPLKSSLASH